MARGKGRKKKCSIKKVGTEGAGAGETAGGPRARPSVGAIRWAGLGLKSTLAVGVDG